MHYIHTVRTYIFTYIYLGIYIYLCVCLYLRQGQGTISLFFSLYSYFIRIPEYLVFSSFLSFPLLLFTFRVQVGDLASRYIYVSFFLYVSIPMYVCIYVCTA